MAVTAVTCPFSVKSQELNKQVFKTYERALTFSINSLGVKEQTEFQITQKLSERETPFEIIEKVIIKLKELNYLNDLRFCENYIRYAHQQKKRGPLRIVRELKSKGITDDMLSGFFAEKKLDAELVQELSTIIKRKYAPLHDQKNKQKVFRFLSYRGFTFSDIMVVLRNAESI